MICMLWPTVRPSTMKETYKHWMSTASGEVAISIKIAVNTQEQRNELAKFGDVIINNERRGPVWPVHLLSHAVNAKNNDIIIVVSDDFYSPKGWDKWLIEQFKNYSGSILVNDGHQFGGCMTIPIMTFNCLLALNRHIYHPDYLWQYSDAELYENLTAMKLIKNLRKTSPMFEHKHWAAGKRGFDSIDKYGTDNGGVDYNTHMRRMKLPLKERLK